MAKMLYSATISLDGFMAGPGGDMSWLTDYLGPNPDAQWLMDVTGSLIVGNRTFGGGDPHKGVEEREGEPFGGGWEGQQFILTHHLRPNPRPDLTFVDDLGEAIAGAKAAAGEKYVNILGADVARQCLEAGELDEVFVFIAPLFLGDGTRLFERAAGAPVRLERITVRDAPTVTGMHLRVLR
jgi:dihydrofolate reductase